MTDFSNVSRERTRIGQSQEAKSSSSNVFGASGWRVKTLFTKLALVTVVVTVLFFFNGSGAWAEGFTETNDFQTQVNDLPESQILESGVNKRFSSFDSKADAVDLFILSVKNGESTISIVPDPSSRAQGWLVGENRPIPITRPDPTPPCRDLGSFALFPSFPYWCRYNDSQSSSFLLKEGDYILIAR